MPGIPANITIAGRTPATIKGNLPPLINTAEAARGGFRAGDDTGGGGIEPETPGEGLTPAQWRARLARTGPGTTDPSYDFENLLTYEGAFLIPNRWPSNTNLKINSALGFCYHPPEAGGRNGANGSVFVGSPDGIFEAQVPANLKPSERDYLELDTVTLLQDWVDVKNKVPIPPTNPDNHNIGWIKIIDGKLYCSMYDTYMPSGSNSENMLICNDATDLAGATYQGMIHLDGEDKTVNYTIDVPTERQAAFGGTHLSGICASISIIGRSSFGHSLFAWNPSQIDPEDVFVPSTTWTYYSGDTAIQGFSQSNTNIVQHYQSVLGVSSLKTFVDSDPSTRINTFDGLALPDEDERLHLVSWDTKSNCGFFVPGTDTIAFIGMNSGMRFGIGYKNKTIEYGNTKPASSGSDPYSASDFDTVIWTMNVNDVLSRTLPGDTQYSSFNLLNDPWSTNWGTELEGGGNKARLGSFDPTTNKLYLVHQSYPWSAYSSQWVVSVFQVNEV